MANRWGGSGVIRVQLDAVTMSRVRWAPSPAYEAVGWLTLTAAGRRHPQLGDPGAAARYALRDPRVAVTAALMAGALHGRYMPDFVTPKPPPDPGSRHGSNLQAQLDLIRATPIEKVETQLALLGTGPGEGTRFAPHGLAAVVTEGLATFWRLALADRWPSIQQRLQRAQDQQLLTVGDGGVGEVLSHLHPAVRWQQGWLEIDKAYSEDVALHDTELVLVPTVMSWPRLAVQVCDPTDAMIAFPVDPTATRASPPHPHALLGRGRTRVLQAVTAPRSTTALSEELAMAASTVSHHLGVLLDTGLVTRTRRGHQVLYRRTPAADLLLNTVATEPARTHTAANPSWVKPPQPGLA